MSAKLPFMKHILRFFRPEATARISGNPEYPHISGTVYFLQTPMGVLVAAEVENLPHEAGECTEKIFGFHIHRGSKCSGNDKDPFANTLGHYDPHICPHPKHAGDMPPLFGNKGYAFQVFLTDRFTVKEVIGKTVIIHSMPDDFTSQPSGNAGQKIACGEIKGR